jgi:tetratricopeptide (TPR) repeat protein
LGVDTPGAAVYRRRVIRQSRVLAAIAFLSACDTPPAPPAPAKPEAAPVASPAPAGPTCRALVNLLAEGGEYRVADVRVTGDRIDASTGAGTVVRDAAGLHGLWITSRAVGAFKWQTLMGQPLAGGPRLAWLDTDPGIPSDPEPCAAGETCDDLTNWYADHNLSILGTFGPYVSLNVVEDGFAGGAHGYDGTRMATLGAPAGARVEGPALLDAVTLAQIERSIKADPGYDALDDEKPEVKKLEDLGWFGLALRPLGDRGSKDAKGATGIYLSATLFCCTWVQNHNMYYLEHRLDPVPPALAPFAPSGSAGLAAPDGCGSVDPASGEFVAAGGKRHDLSGQVLGVYWVDPADPVDVARLPGPSPQLATAQGHAKAGRHAEAVETLRALIRDTGPEAGALAELGWALFHLRQLEEAERVTREALELTRSDRTKGALLYNLGRIAEERGDAAAALEHYTRSLAARDNRTVKRRLDKLQKTKRGAGKK